MKEISSTQMPHPSFVIKWSQGISAAIWSLRTHTRIATIRYTRAIFSPLLIGPRASSSFLITWLSPRSASLTLNSLQIARTESGMIRIVNGSPIVSQSANDMWIPASSSISPTEDMFVPEPMIVAIPPIEPAYAVVRTRALANPSSLPKPSCDTSAIAIGISIATAVVFDITPKPNTTATGFPLKTFSMERAILLCRFHFSITAPSTKTPITMIVTAAAYEL